jgi:hypothetical protein
MDSMNRETLSNLAGHSQLASCKVDDFLILDAAAGPGLDVSK